MYFGVAATDDQRQPEAKDKLRESFAGAKVPAQVEVYSAKNGWCVPDMPNDAGAPIYNEAKAERAWMKLLGLYKVSLG
jgi:carboxymethylenebutenolidase